MFEASSRKKSVLVPIVQQIHHSSNSSKWRMSILSFFPCAGFFFRFWPAGLCVYRKRKGQSSPSRVKTSAANTLFPIRQQQHTALTDCSGRQTSCQGDDLRMSTVPRLPHRAGACKSAIRVARPSRVHSELETEPAPRVDCVCNGYILNRRAAYNGNEL